MEPVSMLKHEHLPLCVGFSLSLSLMLYEVPIVEELLKEQLQDKTLAGSTYRRLCSLQFLRRHSRKDLLKDSKDVFGGKSVSAHFLFATWVL